LKENRNSLPALHPFPSRLKKSTFSEIVKKGKIKTKNGLKSGYNDVNNEQGKKI